MKSQPFPHGFGFWGFIDYWSHRIKITPGWLQSRICDRFDKSVMEPLDDIDWSVAEEGQPRPDYDPHLDHPERYRDGPI